MGGCANNSAFINVHDVEALILSIRSENDALLNHLYSTLDDPNIGCGTPKRKQVLNFIELMDNLIDFIEGKRIRKIEIFATLLKDCYDNILNSDIEECKKYFDIAYNFFRLYPPVET